jgi:hypothetical protein
MCNINLSYIHKTLDSIAVKVKNASRLNNGIVLVEVSSKKQADILLKASLLGFYSIQVEVHTSLNSSLGIVSTDSLNGIMNEEIQSALAD